MGQDIGLSCCGTPLPSIPLFFDHFEGHHARQKWLATHDATAFINYGLYKYDGTCNFEAIGAPDLGLELDRICSRLVVRGDSIKNAGGSAGGGTNKEWVGVMEESIFDSKLVE